MLIMLIIIWCCCAWCAVDDEDNSGTMNDQEAIFCRAFSQQGVKPSFKETLALTCMRFVRGSLEHKNR